MRTHEDFAADFAGLMKRLRTEKRLSLRKAADIMNVDYHTFGRYESGESAPTVPDFVRFCADLGIDALPAVLEYVYPTVYGRNATDDINQIREGVAHFFAAIARDHEVREMEYLINGNHGSSLSSQIAMYTMIDHLPMYYRVAVAQLINTLWIIAESRGELLETDKTMPDVELFRKAMHLGTDAVINGREHYSILPNGGANDGGNS